jgi:hypothetical protein
MTEAEARLAQAAIRVTETLIHNTASAAEARDVLLIVLCAISGDVDDQLVADVNTKIRAIGRFVALTRGSRSWVQTTGHFTHSSATPHTS